MFKKLSCPICGGTVEEKSKEKSDDGTVVALMFGDLFGWCVAGAFAAVGLVWWPGYILGIGVVIWLLWLNLRLSPDYYCERCNEHFSNDALITPQSATRSNPTVEGDARKNSARPSP